MRAEIRRIEKCYNELARQKELLVAMDMARDWTVMKQMYAKDVQEDVDKARIDALKYIKDNEVAGRAIPAGGGGAPGVGGLAKKEAFRLPKFSGDERMAYLKFPIWHSQWNALIEEYPENYRSTVLLEHLDATALTKIVGLESKYAEAMVNLKAYYGDGNKVVQDCLNEIRLHLTVQAHNYKGLVSLNTCIANNHARLKELELDHNLSNTGTMSKARADVIAHPFDEFLEWMKDTGKSWEMLAANGTGVRSEPGKGAGAELSGDGCCKCGESGHFRKDCPKGEESERFSQI